jgi:hypothetical protein
MTEQYHSGGGQPYIPRWQIKKMKKEMEHNMKKLPEIEKKAKQYQKKEEQEAEKLLHQIDS